MTEKRRHPRLTVGGMDIRAKTILNAEAEILDISPTGVSVRCPKRLNIGSPYTFKFNHGESELSVKGIIVWEKLTGSRRDEGDVVPIYTAGVEFREVLTDKARRLMTIIADRVRELRERRLSGVRIRLHGTEKMVLTQLEACAIKDLSLGGMRVEIAHELAAHTVFGFKLILPDNGATIQCRGMVVFCTRGLDGPQEQYSVGVEFLEMSDDDKMTLKLFIDTLVPSLIVER